MTKCTFGFHKFTKWELARHSNGDAVVINTGDAIAGAFGINLIHTREAIQSRRCELCGIWQTKRTKL